MLPDFTSTIDILFMSCAFGYLLGSIPFGILIAKLLGLGDLRKIGSGNIGATNVLRTGNKLAAFLTLLFDFSKGALAVILINQNFNADAVQFAAIGALLGHCFPVALSFPIGAICCCVWLLVALLARMSSLSSLISATSAPITALVLNQPQLGALLVFLAIIVFFRHQQNIARILKGVEPKIGKTE
jgi:glycerol-3-phosphate acyltransferase PlsY